MPDITVTLTAEEARTLAWAADGWAWHCHDQTPGMPSLDQPCIGPSIQLFNQCRLLLALTERLRGAADLDRQ